MARPSLACAPASARASTHNPPPAAFPSTIDLSRLYRAHVEPEQLRKPARTVFIEAWSERSAHERIAQAIAAIDWCRREDAARRTHSIEYSADLIRTGCSDDPLLRLFELHTCAGSVTEWVTQPVILIEHAAPLIRAWSAISLGVQP